MTARGSCRVCAVLALVFSVSSFAQIADLNICRRSAPGSEITDLPELRSENGILRVSLSLRISVSATGETRYCYVDENGNQAPTLRVNPGDSLILKLKNELPNSSSATSSVSLDPVVPRASRSRRVQTEDANCASGGAMHAASTNLHFHGLQIPPACHQDDVLHTAIQPGDPPYEYRMQIPCNQPPGLYWYHPHPHGHSEEQVLGGASGALIVEGIEGFNTDLAGLPERLLVIRDQVRQSATEPGLKPPAKDLSVNFVPVPYPTFPSAIMRIKPSRRELWRVLNASADTFLELHLLTNGKWQSMGLVAIDGVPLDYEEIKNKINKMDHVRWTPSISIPPGGRAEFIFDSPAEGQAQLLTAGVDTVPFVGEEDPTSMAASTGNAAIRDDDDYTPPRWIVTIVAARDAPEATSILPAGAAHREILRMGRVSVPLITARPKRQRRLYFSEKILDPKNPATSTVFYLTEQGHKPSAGTEFLHTIRASSSGWISETRPSSAHSPTTVTFFSTRTEG